MSKPQVMPVDTADMVEDIKLTTKQRLFVEAYFANDFNATQAAIQAGYSERSARAIAAENMAKPAISRAISLRMKSALASIEVDANEVLRLLVSHMRGNMADFIDPDTLAIDFKKAKAAEKLHLVKKFKCTTMLRTTPDGNDIQTDTVEFELYDAQAAAVHLGKHLDLFNNKVDITYTDLSKMSDEQLLKLAEGKKV